MGPDVAQIIIAILGGSVGSQIVAAWLKGIQQARRAKGQEKTKYDMVLQSRLWWRDTAFEMRKHAIEQTDPPDIDPTCDPLVRWEQKQGEE